MFVSVGYADLDSMENEICMARSYFDMCASLLVVPARWKEKTIAAPKIGAMD